MPTVTFIISDTPAGAVSVRTDFVPAIGARCSPAQAAALEIIRRTRRDYGMDPSTLPIAAGEVDMDAIYHSREQQLHGD